MAFPAKLPFQMSPIQDDFIIIPVMWQSLNEDNWRKGGAPRVTHLIELPWLKTPIRESIQ